MKILQLTNKIPYPPKDGGAIATLNLSVGLANLGHEITLLGMNTTKHYVDLKDIPAELSEKITFKEVKLDTKLSFFEALQNLLFSKLPYNAQRFFCQNYRHRLKELLQEQSFDVVQLEGLYMAWYIDTIRKYSKALVALRAHNIEHEIWYRNAEQEKSFLKSLYLKNLARRIKRFKTDVINSYDLLVPITRRDASSFDFFGNNKPSLVVPAGFDTAAIQSQPEQIKFLSVFFIGTLDWFPNQEGLIWFIEKVWPAVISQHPDIIFHVAGRNAPPWLRDKLLNVKNINFLGEIDDAHAFIREHAIMVAPLFSGSGMRVKIIEGMALGKTIVTTSIGAEGIDISHGENIFVEDQPGEFARRISELIQNKDLFDQMGNNAVQFVREHYDNQRISVSLAEFYKNHL